MRSMNDSVDNDETFMDYELHFPPNLFSRLD